MLKKSFFTTLLLLMFLASAGCSETDSEGNSLTKGKTYQIGVVTPLSGPEAGYGLEQKALLDLRVTELNAKNDYTVELLYEDGKCESEASVQALKNLVAEKNVKFVIGGFCAGATLVMAPIADQYELVLLSPSTTNPSLEGASQYVLSLAYPDTVLAKAFGAELARSDKFALLSENLQESGVIERNLDNVLATQNKIANFVYNEKFDSGMTDFTELLKNLDKSRAEAVLLDPNSEDSALALLKAIEVSGLKIKLIGTAVFANQQVLTEAPDIVNGMTIISLPTVDNAQLKPYAERLLVEQAMSLEKLDPYFVASSLDALDILSKLVAENNGDVASVQKGLSTGTFYGFLGKVTFDGATFRKDVEADKKVVVEKQLSKFGQKI